jgi:hypothetical protein
MKMRKPGKKEKMICTTAYDISIEKPTGGKTITTTQQT